MANKETVGFQNIELISDRPFEDWEEDFKRVKDEHPDQVLIGSVMESFEKGRWQEVCARSAEAGCDVRDNVTKSTTLLIVGDPDVRKLAGHK